MSQLEIGIFTLEDLKEYGAFHAASPQGTIFSSPRWLELTAKVTGSKLEILAARDGNTIFCAIPILERKKLWYSVVTSNPLSPYNGILLAPSMQNEARVHEVLKSMLQSVVSSIKYIHLSVHSSFHDLRPFMWEGWRMYRLYTYLIDITDEATLWAGFSQSLRRKVRRAEDDGITVTETDDTALLAEQYQYSYQRHGISEPIPTARIRAWAEGARTCGGRIFHAKDERGNVLASRMVIVAAPFVYDWIAGSTDAGNTSSANHVLVTDIMRRLSGEGVTTFDFRGANTPGVVDFKRSFGGVLLGYTEAVYKGSKLLSVAEGLNGRLTRFRRGL